MNVTAMPRAAEVSDEIYRLDRWAELTLAHLLGTQAGLTPGNPLTAMQIGAKLGVAERHQRVIDRWIRVLAGAGLCAFDPHSRTAHAVHVPDATTVQQAFEDTASVQHCCGPALRRFYGACADRLGELLRDELTVQSLLFTDPQTTDEIYAGNAASRQVNALAAARTAELAPHDGRVLEIGAGTGATTAPVLQLLPSSVRYEFTDVSEYFLDAARHRWAHRNAFSAAHYDLHQNAEQQGYEAGGIDVVLAANVLHNGLDAADTLRRIARLLRPGGHVVMIETGREHHPLLLSMYLLMSPQPGRADARPTDQRRHDGRILLRRDEWAAAALAAGLELVSVEPDMHDPLSAMAQFVLIARRPESGVRR